MRDHPFTQAGDPPRPYSEIRAERQASDPRQAVRAHIAMLEAEAAGASTEAERKLLQCEAAALRCALDKR